MDLTDTITDDFENTAVDGPPLLPSLPPAPMLPPSSTPDIEAPAEAWISLPVAGPKPAPDASYVVMPGKPRAGQPSPAALQAAEQRRQAKKRRRIRRIVLLLITIAVFALAGPPAVRWIADGLDKAGSTETEPPTIGDGAD
jgi:hypothetical protein